MNIQEDFLYCYTVVGEKDRYYFLERFLSINKLTNITLLTEKNIIVTFGINENVSKKDDFWLIETPALIPQTCLFFPTNGLEVPNNGIGKIILFESNPFCKNSNVTFLETLRTENLKSHIVVGLMDLPRYQAFTDLLPAGEDLRRAIQTYQEYNLDTIVLKEAKDIQKVLDLYESAFSVWKRCLCNNVDLLENKIKNNDIMYDFQYLWEELPPNSIRFPEIQAQKICSYTNIKKVFDENRLTIHNSPTNLFLKSFFGENKKTHKGNITLWQSYVDSCYKILFPANNKDGVFVFVPLYRQTIEEAGLAFWDVEEDKKELVQKLKDSFFSTFENSKYACLVTPVFKNEDEYEKNLADKNQSLYGIRAEFSRILNSYVKNGIISIIQGFVQERYERLRGLLS